jgi:hypothetical protein
MSTTARDRDFGADDRASSSYLIVYIRKDTIVEVYALVSHEGLSNHLTEEFTRQKADKEARQRAANNTAVHILNDEYIRAHCDALTSGFENSAEETQLGYPTRDNGWTAA